MKSISKTLFVIALTALSFSAKAGALDGGTAPMATDVAVAGTITTTGGDNTVVGSGAAITNPSAPANGWSNTAVGAGATITGGNNTSLGANTNNTGAASVAIGNQATAGNGVNSVGNIAIGFQSTAINNLNGNGEQGAVAIGNQANATGINSVAIGSGAVAVTDNSVSFGGGITPTRTLQNVTAGTLATDAVNVGQLQTAISGMSSVDQIARDAAGNAQTTADAAMTTAIAVDGKATTALTQSSQALGAANTAQASADLANQRIGLLDQQFRDLRTEARQGIAMASAQARIPSALPAGAQRVAAVGVGTFRGETALAAGAAFRIAGDRTVSLALATTGTDAALSAGLSWAF